MREGGHKVQISSHEINKSGDAMYSPVTIVNNNPVLYTLKFILIILIIPVKQTHT